MVTVTAEHVAADAVSFAHWSDRTRDVLLHRLISTHRALKALEYFTSNPKPTRRSVKKLFFLSFSCRFSG